MALALTDVQRPIAAANDRQCEPFDADCWLQRDIEGGLPQVSRQTPAAAGGLGLAMPKACGSPRHRRSGADLPESPAQNKGPHHF